MDTTPTGRLQYFPVTHRAALVAALIMILVIAFWPNNNNDYRLQKSITMPIPQQSAGSRAAASEQWKSDTVRGGDSLSVLFDRNNLSAADMIAIASMAPRDSLTLRPGQKIHWLTSSEGRIRSLEIEFSPLAKHHFSRELDGSFEYQLLERSADRVARFADITINNSLFLDGAEASIPEPVLIEVAAIFGWDIDFALDIRQGDQLSLIYEEVFLDGEKIGNGNILIARFVNQGREITAVRYEDSEGKANYYTPEGLSMRKEFLRNPIDFFRVSSRFNLKRKHPIYNTIRAHKGTDYAAPTGTPVKAVGDGKIIFAGRKGSYGNLIILRHNNRYETRYAHLNAFHRSVRSGRTVKQGQIIGYVGTTGASTGPHLHYEFRVDGVYRDSLRFEFPKSESISSKEKPDFLKKALAMVTWLDGSADSAL